MTTLRRAALALILLPQAAPAAKARPDGWKRHTGSFYSIRLPAGWENPFGDRLPDAVKFLRKDRSHDERAGAVSIDYAAHRSDLKTLEGFAQSRAASGERILLKPKAVTVGGLPGFQVAVVNGSEAMFWTWLKAPAGYYTLSAYAELAEFDRLRPTFVKAVDSFLPRP